MVVGSAGLAGARGRTSLRIIKGGSRSLGEEHYQRRTLQQGLDAIEDFFKEVGMAPSRQDNKYVIINRGHEDRMLQLEFAGIPILAEPEIKIFGVDLG
ncbi:hypothetical protein IscW_ISCW023778 [Ixodes scapularis]|uniref:Uncharacterized protein n=1 Tax=Ixodes scapularis TaxID=6945 RepID=B7QMC9_IXOSC|nr:hypothetical protein IscW_ISCW023778 [Ixodes scapularis]|eukprot:XP_002416334.1 hypothetical protein IscW_ISCW023778 [Ixodes scapularis]